MDTQENARVLTIPETATYLRCCVRTVFRRIRAGQLETLRIRGSRRVYVSRDSADAFLRARFERAHRKITPGEQDT